MIDLGRQLAGKLVDAKVMGALEWKGFMPPQQMPMIDAILSLPGTTLEAEYQRRIHAINAVAAFCGVEEGRPIQFLFNSAGGHCRTMMNVAVLPSGLNPLLRMRLILPCARRWNP